MRRSISSLTLALALWGVLLSHSAWGQTPGPVPPQSVGVGCGQMPALSGDTTSSAGSCTTTTSKTGGVAFGTAATASAGTLPAQSGATQAVAGKVGEIAQVQSFGTSFATVTISHASPAVITWTAQTLSAQCIDAAGTKCIQPVRFTGLGGSAGISNNVTYFVDPASYTTNSFQIATTVANAVAGTDVNTTTTDSGTATNTAYVTSTTTPYDIQALILSGGDWDCNGQMFETDAASNIATQVDVWTNTASATNPFDVSNTHIAATLATSGYQSMLAGTKQYLLSGPTAVIMGGEVVFSGGTTNPTLNGTLRCRRVQ